MLKKMDAAVMSCRKDIRAARSQASSTSPMERPVEDLGDINQLDSRLQEGTEPAF